jgi:methylglyoxal synthase
MTNKKRIALVAHDHRKKDLIEWVESNYQVLIQHRLVSTGTTGSMVEKAIRAKLREAEQNKLELQKLNSGPLGGDQQLGAMIAENKVDFLIFLWDPMQPQPHDVDVKALLRIAVLYNIPTANNLSTADFIISSPLMISDYQPLRKDYSGYITRYD